MNRQRFSRDYCLPGHKVRRAEKVWMFNERGELIISTLSRRGFREISPTRLIEPTKAQLSQRDGVCWSHPACACPGPFRGRRA